MTELLWWQTSPSPFSIAWYCVYGLLAHKLGLSWKESAWLTGFTVLSADAMWVAFSLVRWAWYVDTASIIQAGLALLRDLAGLFMFYILLSKLWGTKVKWNKKVCGWYIFNGLFFFWWFGLAPSIAWTDWTYAITHEFSLFVVFGSFFFSHVVGRVCVAFILRSWIAK